MGVEHTELAKVVTNAVIKDMGTEVDNVIAFVSDSAAVLKCAYDSQLSHVFPNAVWVRCLSHGLNNVAKVFYLVKL